MKARPMPAWDGTPAHGRAIQKQLAPLVRRTADLGPASQVVGVDMAGLRRGPVRAAAVVVGLPGLDLVDWQVAEAQVSFPYVPGLLAFREAPAVAAALEKLSVAPGLLLVDGQGLAHPRRFGIACYLGLMFDIPTIGCAKSRLIGEHGPVPDVLGAWTELRDEGEVIGAVVRTRPGSAPLYVSIGHKVDVETAIHWVVAACRGHRLPEPLRLAHLAAGGQRLALTMVP
ncbi:MAG: endonuclease V [Chloroflexi bacterium]|nr:endonuclease V [Chloroflexota bacterium]